MASRTGLLDKPAREICREGQRACRAGWRLRVSSVADRSQSTCLGRGHLEEARPQAAEKQGEVAKLPVLATRGDPRMLRLGGSRHDHLSETEGRISVGSSTVSASTSKST